MIILGHSISLHKNLYDFESQCGGSGSGSSCKSWLDPYQSALIFGAIVSAIAMVEALARIAVVVFLSGTLVRFVRIVGADLVIAAMYMAAGVVSRSHWQRSKASEKDMLC